MRSKISRHRSKQASASSYLAWAWYVIPRLLRTTATWGWSGPRALLPHLQGPAEQPFRLGVLSLLVTLLAEDEEPGR